MLNRKGCLATDFCKGFCVCELNSKKDLKDAKHHMSSLWERGSGKGQGRAFGSAGPGAARPLLAAAAGKQLRAPRGNTRTTRLLQLFLL